MMQVEPEKESVKVLYECAELQLRKSRDYQNPNSRIKQADHYPRGVNTIIDMVHQKITRAYSLLEAAEHSQVDGPQYESIEDSFKDAINYLSFGVSYLRHRMEGQKDNRDIFNRDRGPMVNEKPYIHSMPVWPEHTNKI